MDTGSYLDARFLFEFAGIMHPDVNDGAEQESLARVLLEKLGMSTEEIAELSVQWAPGNSTSDGGGPVAEQGAEAAKVE